MLLNEAPAHDGIVIEPGLRFHALDTKPKQAGQLSVVQEQVKAVAIQRVIAVLSLPHPQYQVKPDKPSLPAALVMDHSYAMPNKNDGVLASRPRLAFPQAY